MMEKQKKYKRNNMIWIKMINYEIIHSSFMLWCALEVMNFSSSFFPFFSGVISTVWYRKILKFASFFFLFSSINYESGELFDFSSTESIRDVEVFLLRRWSNVRNFYPFFPALNISSRRFTSTLRYHNFPCANKGENRIIKKVD